MGPSSQGHSLSSLSLSKADSQGNSHSPPRRVEYKLRRTEMEQAASYAFQGILPHRPSCQSSKTEGKKGGQKTYQSVRHPGCVGGTSPKELAWSLLKSLSGGFCLRHCPQTGLSSMVSTLSCVFSLPAAGESTYSAADFSLTGTVESLAGF